MQRKLLIITFVIIFLLSQLAYAQEWECRYDGYTMLISKSLYYQCPPILKKFYKLQQQTSFVDVPRSGGGGGGGIYPIEVININDSEKNDTNQTQLDSPDLLLKKGLKIILIVLCVAMVIIGIWVGFKKLKETGNGTKR